MLPDKELVPEAIDLQTLRRLLAGVVDFDDPQFQERVKERFKPSAMPETLHKAMIAMDVWQTFYPNARLTPDNARRMAEVFMVVVGLIDPTPQILQDLEALPSGIVDEVDEQG